MPDHDTALVRELASLARLELSADEAAGFGAQLDTILGYIRRLQTVEVEGVPEYLTAEQVRSGLREDVEGARFDADRALAAVPVVHDRLVAVPKFKDSLRGPEGPSAARGSGRSLPDPGARAKRGGPGAAPTKD